ncbi:hypothetical protein SAMN06295905_2088 [Devosia lucknowensis]|uniref:Response regulatory domain-containing protein n=1 Tax=Devosia lucknowensis TaxID=1096929 RepID=A0A1Y6FBN0_9HYPH|nr:hypothetical protein [Devosia lucknowensis]SMQ72215.1 hypothetical protein SAMN06295905_2088 [Devosia lucknowensis]
MLAGRTVLVVETEIIIALSIQSVLETLDAAHITIAGNPRDAQDDDALSLVGLAIIELELHRPASFELARKLHSRGIPIVGITADFRLREGVPELPGTPVIVKPVPDDDIIRAIRLRLDQNPLPDVT